MQSYYLNRRRIHYGSDQQLSIYSRCLVEQFNATVVNISYRFSPEYKFPTAPNDAWDSLVWISENAMSLEADTSKGSILGDVSSGGNLTTVIRQKAVDVGLSPYRVMVMHPLIFPSDKVVPDPYRELWFSREQNAEAPILNRAAIGAINSYYQADIYSPLCSPFNSKTPHTGVPRCYIQANGMDPLRDDALIYEEVLKKDGVQAKIDIWPGLPHAHFVFFSGLEVSVKAILDTLNGFSWLLGLEMTLEKPKEALHVSTPVETASNVTARQ